LTCSLTSFLTGLLTSLLTCGLACLLASLLTSYTGFLSSGLAGLLTSLLTCGLSGFLASFLASCLSSLLTCRLSGFLACLLTCLLASCLSGFLSSLLSSFLAGCLSCFLSSCLACLLASLLTGAGAHGAWLLRSRGVILRESRAGQCECNCSHASENSRNHALHIKCLLRKSGSGSFPPIQPSYKKPRPMEIDPDFREEFFSFQLTRASATKVPLGLKLNFAVRKSQADRARHCVNIA
jgi:hypothetical protein